MRTLHTITELRGALSQTRREGHSIGLVPTMGALHDGHLSLIARAREQCEQVVVSLFVNPTQFNERADLERYPREQQRDAQLAQTAGADILFAPSPQEVYPAGFATTVEVSGISECLEGAARGASHFRGVCTVVTKLLCMVGPDVAYFGQKDAQQVLVIRRLVADLNLPVRIETCPTVREPDGLAMSSRNALLSTEERLRARALPATLNAVRGLAATGEQDVRTLLASAERELCDSGIELEYLTLTDAETLKPLDTLDRPGLLALAARVGSTRLIDNLVLYPRPSQNQDQTEREAAARCSV